jgi:hypothetical protein
MTTYALFAPIENNTNNLNTSRGIVSIERRYEDEAVACFAAWRQRGGWLKDIPIYAMCPTHNTVSSSTQQKFAELGVSYIEEFHPITDTFTSGFLNSPYVGSVLETRLTEDVLIKIDLDMNLIQPLPEQLLTTGSTVCGQYDDYCTKQQRQATTDGPNPFDTGFVITPRHNNFYQLWFNEVKALLDAPGNDPEWQAIKQVTGEYYLEEYVVDKIYRLQLANITPIQKYQIGEWYTPVSQFTDEELTRVYFWHEHIIPDPAYNKIREKVEYFNRMKRMAK